MQLIYFSSLACSMQLIRQEDGTEIDNKNSEGRRSKQHTAALGSRDRIRKEKEVTVRLCDRAKKQTI
jgi:hypothetical protein